VAFRFELHESVADGVRRIAIGELDAALAALSGDTDLDRDGEIHDCRKRCKKLRALIRLARPGLGRRYRTVNDDVRDAARALSHARDAQALAATFDRVRVQEAALDLASVSSVLDRDAEVASQRADATSDHATTAMTLLRGVREGVPAWPLERLDTGRRGFAGLRPGLTTTYDRARRAMTASRRRGDPEAFHEWRRHAKYGWYQLRLVHDAAPSVLGPLAAVYSDLADALGDAHDLAVLAERFRHEHDRFDRAADVATALELVEHDRRALEHRSLAVGARLYAEPPSVFVDRLEAYWRVWRRLGDEPAVGAIDVVLPARALPAE
jgi:CHAD domain-containing protein